MGGSTRVAGPGSAGRIAALCASVRTRSP